MGNQNLVWDNSRRHLRMKETRTTLLSSEKLGETKTGSYSFPLLFLLFVLLPTLSWISAPSSLSLFGSSSPPPPPLDPSLSAREPSISSLKETHPHCSSSLLFLYRLLYCSSWSFSLVRIVITYVCLPLMRAPCRPREESRARVFRQNCKTTKKRGMRTRPPSIHERVSI